MLMNWKFSSASTRPKPKESVGVYLSFRRGTTLDNQEDEAVHPTADTGPAPADYWVTWPGPD